MIEHILTKEWFRNAVAPYSPTALENMLYSGEAMAFGYMDQGAIFVTWLEPGLVEWHWMLGPDMVMENKIGLVEYALEQLRKRDVTEIVGRTPKINLAARIMNRHFGAVPVGVEGDYILYHLYLNSIHPR
jgi:hypothetical protein